MSEDDQEMEMSVSVVIPCYNVGRYVSDAVRSVVGQDHTVREIVCIDDGSTDDTVARLASLEAEYPRLLKVIRQTNQGAPAARNAGLFASSGAYIQFLDADDVLLSDKLSHQLALIKRSGGVVDFVAAAYKRELSSGQVEIKRIEAPDPWKALIKGKAGITSSNLWRRAALLEIKGWDIGLGSSQEADLMFRLLVRGARVEFDTHPKTLVRTRPGSISTTNAALSLGNNIELRRAIREYMLSVGSYSSDVSRAWNGRVIALLEKLHYRDPGKAERVYRDLEGLIDSRRINLLFRLMLGNLGFSKTMRIRHLANRVQRGVAQRLRRV